MADSSVEITAGSGTPVDTRTVGTGDHRQVVVLGDPTTNTGVAPVDVTYGLAVDVKRSELPSGAATAARQDTGNTSLSSIDGKITACNTGSVTVAASALPSGAATSAKQDTGNASLSSIDGKVPALGQALAAASVPVVLTAAQVSTLTPPAAITGFSTETTLSALNAKVTAVNTGAVVVSSSALPTGAATESTLSTLNGKVTACDTGAVVVSSSALPSGAATAAKQPALGTAGTASADVITVQGVASMTALKVDGSAVTQPVSGTVTANIGSSGPVRLEDAAFAAADPVMMAGGVNNRNLAVVFNSTAGDVTPFAVGDTGVTLSTLMYDDSVSVAKQAVKLEDSSHTTGDAGVFCLGVLNTGLNVMAGTDGDYSPICVGARGDVFTTLWHDSSIGGSGPIRQEDQPFGGGETVMMSGMIRQDTPTNNTSADSDVQPLKGNNLGALWVAVDSTAQVSAASGLLKAEDAAHGSGDAGVVMLARRKTSPAVSSGADGDYSTLDVNDSGALWTTPIANVGGGYSKANWNAQTTTVREVKGTAGKLHGYYFYNPNSSVAYVQLFDVASATSVTLGTTAPNMVLGIPATSGANLSDAIGIAFTLGIKFACTTTETGNIAPATGLTCNFWYI